MKKIILAILLLSGCSFQMTPTPETELVLKQHSIVLDAVVRYIKDLQEKGVLPKPEEKK